MGIFLTGGSGLLGTELRKLDQTIVAPKRADFDITDKGQVLSVLTKERPDAVIHAAAASKPPEYEKNPEIGIANNIVGTANVASACLQLGIKLIYISTDFVYHGDGPHKEDEALLPPSKFGWSKLGGECSVRMVPRSLILRVDFGPVPFPWEKVYADHFVSKLYVDEIAPLILRVARSGAEGVMNVGGPKTSLEAYARRTRPDIDTIPKPAWVPEDTSMDLSKMCEVLGIRDTNSLLKR